MPLSKPKTILAGALALLCLPVYAAPEVAVVKDVPASHWAAPAVKRVMQKKMMTTDADGKFHGDRPVTRYELAVILDRFARYIEQGRQPISQAPPVPVSLKKAMPTAPLLALTHLIGSGFLPYNTPLYSRDGTKPVTAQETADATAQVVTRLSDRALPPTPH